MAYTPAQRKIIRAIRRNALRRYASGGFTKAEKRKVRSAYMTGRVESNFHNLRYGDADSLGWRQERQSKYRNPRNVRASVRRYFKEANRHYHGQSAGELAADVQRPLAIYRGRYGRQEREARRLTRKVVRRAQRNRFPRTY